MILDGIPNAGYSFGDQAFVRDHSDADDCVSRSLRPLLQAGPRADAADGEERAYIRD